MTRQACIDIARVYQPRTSDVECRVLVDRLWPRGLAASAADLDSWCRDIAPSTTLRRWYAHRAARYSEFRERYLTELDDPAHIEALLRLQAITEQGHLILLTAVRDLNVSHAAILAERLCCEAGRHVPTLTHVHIHAQIHQYRAGTRMTSYRGRGTRSQRCATSAPQQLDYPRKVPPRL